MAVAALVLGIVSLSLCIIGLGFPIGTLCGIVGVILGVMGRRNTPEKSGMATAGLICSIAGVVLSLIFIVACAACLGGMGALSSF